jgi:hypothetical protein
MTLKELVSIPVGTYPVVVVMNFKFHPQKLFLEVKPHNSAIIFYLSKYLERPTYDDGSLSMYLDEKKMMAALKSKKNSPMLFSFAACGEQHFVKIKPENFNLITN